MPRVKIEKFEFEDQILLSIPQYLPQDHTENQLAHGGYKKPSSHRQTKRKAATICNIRILRAAQSFCPRL
jgi:hypothetical protein